jgi:hypothetical protein
MSGMLAIKFELAHDLFLLQVASDWIHNPMGHPKASKIRER